METKNSYINSLNIFSLNFNLFALQDVEGTSELNDSIRWYPVLAENETTK